MLPLTPGHRYTDAANDVEWLPYACKRQSLSSPSLKAEVDQCLAGKRIYFQGDSHSRTIFNGFTDRICGVAGAGVKQEITQHGGVCASPGQVIHGGVPECTLQEVCEWEDLYYTWRPGAYVSVSSKTLQHSACGHLTALGCSGFKLFDSTIAPSCVCVVGPGVGGSSEAASPSNTHHPDPSPTWTFWW